MLVGTVRRFKRPRNGRPCGSQAAETEADLVGSRYSKKNRESSLDLLSYSCCQCHHWCLTDLRYEVTHGVQPSQHPREPLARIPAA